MLLLLLLACPASPPQCPEGFVLARSAAGPFCIQATEARITVRPGDGAPRSGPEGATGVAGVTAVPGQVPTMLVSWRQAVAACRSQGWRLCTSEEWEDACDGQPGPGGATYPTPDGTLHADQCAIAQMQERHQPFPAAHFPTCHTPTGIYDLEGNVWEWTDPGRVDAAGQPVIDKRGGGWYSGIPATCSQAAVGTHTPDFDGSIGFRCCTDPE